MFLVLYLTIHRPLLENTDSLLLRPKMKYMQLITEYQVCTIQKFSNKMFKKSYSDIILFLLCIMFGTWELVNRTKVPTAMQLEREGPPGPNSFFSLTHHRPSQVGVDLKYGQTGKNYDPGLVPASNASSVHIKSRERL